MITTPFELHELEKNPENINNMDLTDIDLFRHQYKSVRSPELRKLIEQRERELKLQVKVDRLNVEIIQIYQFTVMCINYLETLDRNSIQYKDYFDRACRNIGQMIHDLPNVWTGLTSVALYHQLQQYPNTSIVDEHFYPRKGVGGNDILVLGMEKLKLSGTFEPRDLINALYTYAMCNKTTKRENRKQLPPYQREDTFTDPGDSYRNADVHLFREKEFAVPAAWRGVADLYNVKLMDPPEFDLVDPKAVLAYN